MLDKNSNVYVTGSGLSNHNFDIFTIKYSQNPSNIIATSEIVENYKLEQNYPNPFNPNTTIKYQLPMDCKVTIKIYNTLGQEVMTLINGRQAAGYYSIQWNGKNKQNSSASSGVYIYKLVAESQGKTYVQSKKMLLLK